MIKKIQSSNKKRFYKVEINDEGWATCECKDFLHRQWRNGGWCKHIKIAIQI